MSGTPSRQVMRRALLKRNQFGEVLPYVSPVKPKPREEAWRKYRETGEKYK